MSSIIPINYSYPRSRQNRPGVFINATLGCFARRDASIARATMNIPLERGSGSETQDVPRTYLSALSASFRSEAVMTIRNLSPATRHSYLGAVTKFSPRLHGQIAGSVGYRGGISRCGWGAGGLGGDRAAYDNSVRPNPGLGGWGLGGGRARRSRPSD
jgi:hypothetical protein